MIRTLALPVAAAAFVLTPAAMANNDGVEAHVEGASAAEEEGAVPAKLVLWDGDWELMKTSQRLRVWRSHLAYRLTVGTDGEVTSCELTESFRMAYVAQRLCAVLSEHHTFEPALDKSGTPVEGSYSARISYTELRERL